MLDCGAAHTVIATHKPQGKGEPGEVQTKSDPIVYAWGRSDLGQTGTGICATAAHKMGSVVVPTPREVVGLQGKWVASLACGTNHSIVACWGWEPQDKASLECDVYAFGSNHFGQIGTPVKGAPQETNRLGQYVNIEAVPVRVPIICGKEVIALAAGEAHSLAACREGTWAVGHDVWGWGSNSQGELLGDVMNRTPHGPTLIKAFSPGGAGGSVGTLLSERVNFKGLACGGGQSYAVVAENQPKSADPDVEHLVSWGHTTSSKHNHSRKDSTRNENILKGLKWKHPGTAETVATLSEAEGRLQLDAGDGPNIHLWSAGSRVAPTDRHIPPGLEIFAANLERATRVTAQAQVVSANLDLHQQVYERQLEKCRWTGKEREHGMTRVSKAKTQVNRLKAELEAAERTLLEAERDVETLDVRKAEAEVDIRRLEREGEELQHAAQAEIVKAQNVGSTPIAGRALEANWRYKAAYPQVVRPTWEAPYPPQTVDSSDTEEDSFTSGYNQTEGGSKNKGKRSKERHTRKDITTQVQAMSCAKSLNLKGGKATDSSQELTRKARDRDIDNWMRSLALKPSQPIPEATSTSKGPTCKLSTRNLSRSPTRSPMKSPTR